VIFPSRGETDSSGQHVQTAQNGAGGF